MSGTGTATSPSGLWRGGQPVTDWPSIRTYVLQRDEGACQICQINLASDVDHIWPRRLGGTDHIDNLRAACGPCNKAKGDRVDLRSASPRHLVQALTSLDQKIADLDRERDEFEKELLVRALSGGSDELLKVMAMMIHSLKEQDVKISGRLASLMASSDQLRAESERNLPDAEVVTLRPPDVPA